MKLRALAAALVALVVVTRMAGAEIRLDADTELQRAELLRQAEQQRRDNAAKMRIQIDPEEDLGSLQRGLRPPLRIPDARYRVAVFTFEDPDKTALGNALASLVGRRILVESDVGSIGVLRYEGSLAPSVAQPLSYFDKVETLAELQQVTLAVWGMVRLAGDRILIDTFVQLPPRIVEESFSWALQLPKAMGNAKLVAHLRPARMLVEHYDLPRDDGRAITAAAQALDELRAEPSDGATVVGSLPIAAPYWIVQRKDDWIELATDKQKGWARSGGNCGAACTPLFGAARFSADLLQFMHSRRITAATDSLQADARAVTAQISMLEHLDTAQPGQFEAAVVAPLADWRKRESSSVASPGGVPFANILALSQVATSLYAAVPRSDAPLKDRLDGVKLDPKRVRSIAFELAGSSLQDPRNTDVLNNLAVLFRYAGDTDRAELAERLMKDVSEPR